MSICVHLSAGWPGGAVACRCPWYGLADLCADEGIPCGLGQALAMKALHGGQAKHDRLDAQKLAALLRGGLRPHASVYPAERRATRPLLRRRLPLLRQRAARRSHGHPTNSQDHRPALGKKRADKSNREGGAERLHDPALHPTIAVALALMPYDDALRPDLDLSLLKTAPKPEANPLSRLHTVPGMGQVLRLVLRYAIHRRTRCPRGQDVASYARLVKCRKESSGQRLGTSGHKMGTTPPFKCRVFHAALGNCGCSIDGSG